jgi:DNA-binding MarR family transcriptional regulator
MYLGDPLTKVRKEQRAVKFYAYIKKFFKKEDRFPSLSELQIEFGYSYSMTYKTLLHLEEQGKVERRESEHTNRTHWRFPRK